MNSMVFWGLFLGFLVSPVLCIRYSSSPENVTALPPIIGKWLENELYYRVSNEGFQAGGETSIAVSDNNVMICFVGVACFFFERSSSGKWEEAPSATLDALPYTGNIEFGLSTSLTDDTAAILGEYYGVGGVSGCLYIFKKCSFGWNLDFPYLAVSVDSSPDYVSLVQEVSLAQEFAIVSTFPRINQVVDNNVEMAVFAYDITVNRSDWESTFNHQPMKKMDYELHRVAISTRSDVRLYEQGLGHHQWNDAPSSIWNISADALSLSQEGLITFRVNESASVFLRDDDGKWMDKPSASLHVQNITAGGRQSFGAFMNKDFAVIVQTYQTERDEAEEVRHRNCTGVDCLDAFPSRAYVAKFTKDDEGKFIAHVNNSWTLALGFALNFSGQPGPPEIGFLPAFSVGGNTVVIDGVVLINSSMNSTEVIAQELHNRYMVALQVAPPTSASVEGGAHTASINCVNNTFTVSSQSTFPGYQTNLTQLCGSKTSCEAAYRSYAASDSFIVQSLVAANVTKGYNSYDTNPYNHFYQINVFSRLEDGSYDSEAELQLSGTSQLACGSRVFISDQDLLVVCVNFNRLYDGASCNYDFKLFSRLPDGSGWNDSPTREYTGTFGTYTLGNRCYNQQPVTVAFNEHHFAVNFPDATGMPSIQIYSKSRTSDWPEIGPSSTITGNQYTYFMALSGDILAVGGGLDYDNGLSAVMSAYELIPGEKPRELLVPSILSRPGKFSNSTVGLYGLGSSLFVAQTSYDMWPNDTHANGTGYQEILLRLSTDGSALEMDSYFGTPGGIPSSVSNSGVQLNIAGSPYNVVAWQMQATVGVEEGLSYLLYNVDSEMYKYPVALSSLEQPYDGWDPENTIDDVFVTQHQLIFILTSATSHVTLAHVFANAEVIPTPAPSPMWPTLVPTSVPTDEGCFAFGIDISGKYSPCSEYDGRPSWYSVTDWAACQEDCCRYTWCYQWQSWTETDYYGNISWQCDLQGLNAICPVRKENEYDDIIGRQTETRPTPSPTLSPTLTPTFPPTLWPTYQPFPTPEPTAIPTSFPTSPGEPTPSPTALPGTPTRLPTHGTPYPTSGGLPTVVPTPRNSTSSTPNGASSFGPTVIAVGILCWILLGACLGGAWSWYQKRNKAAIDRASAAAADGDVTGLAPAPPPPGKAVPVAARLSQSRGRVVTTDEIPSQMVSNPMYQGSSSEDPQVSTSSYSSSRMSVKNKNLINSSPIEEGATDAISNL